MKKYFTNKNVLTAFAVLAITAGLYVGFTHFSIAQTTEAAETQTSNSSDKTMNDSAPEQKATITLPTVNVETKKVDPSTDETTMKKPATVESVPMPNNASDN